MRDRDTSTGEDNEKFVRWQGLTISQLTQAVSVVLGLAVAALGFDVTLLMNEKFTPVSWQKCLFGVALLALLLSVAFGVWCVINRLRDFRATMKAARDDNSPEANEARALATRFGQRTWALFWWQIGTFGAGVLSTIAVVAGIYASKLL